MKKNKLKGKLSSKTKNTMLIALLQCHNQSEYPVKRESAIVLFTLLLRFLENAWVTCGSDEVWNMLQSSQTAGSGQQKPGKRSRVENS